MCEPVSLSVSVRDIISVVFIGGDLESAVSPLRLSEGTRIHQKIQGDRSDSISEYEIRFSCVRLGFDLTLSGRIDCIFSDTGVVIDEIKSVKTIDLVELSKRHQAQGLLYAYMYCVEQSLSGCAVQVTYCSFEGNTREFREDFTFSELESFFYKTVESYLERVREKLEFRRIRNESADGFVFPFGVYRRGQREFAVKVFKTISDGKRLIAQAPTGIGKTAAVLFAAVKAMGQEKCEKIFYATARTTGKELAETALKIFENSGIILKSVTLTAKEKICFQDEKKCSPEYCPYAQGYYDRLPGAIRTLLKHNVIRRNEIEETGRLFSICPFELSLDVSLWCDVIICDYNYIFDPRARLKRYFNEPAPGYFLAVDEAHNLVDRARNMYSAELFKKKFFDIKKTIDRKKFKKLYSVLGEVNSEFVSIKKQCIKPLYEKVLYEKPSDMITVVKKFLNEAEKALTYNGDDLSDEFRELYFEALAFYNISEFFGENYAVIQTRSRKDVCIKLLCLDAATEIDNCCKSASAVTFFSATLTPYNYFSCCFGSQSADFIEFPSPFPRKNFRVYIASIPVSYRYRKHSAEQVRRTVIKFCNQVSGNTLIFFPSYAYMREITAEGFENALFQEQDMQESERQKFLDNFTSESSLTACAVLGGVFSEGIDLLGSRLNAAVVVTLGLPQVCTERELMRQYYELVYENGFYYAYVCPGMCRVMQAAGRVIRSESDTGAALLVDSRFLLPEYNKFLPKWWFVSKYK